ncbi:GGDEF domain-containing protein [Lachnospiraceae bacterium OttesenSCG-928-D06]|nr:GGDEF domain-containing protein [Lachnospiraceae bacterium OttesenSCG-928-D06]
MHSNYPLINRIKTKIQQDYFNEDTPLKYHVFSIFLFESLPLSIISALTNTLLGKGLPGLVFQWTFVLLCLILLFSSPTKRMAASGALILMIGFIYIPFMYFQTAGYDGTSLLFSILFIFIASYYFTGKARILIILLNIIEYFICIFLQYTNPNLVVPHGSLEAKIIDSIVAITLTLGGMALMTIYVNNAYKAEHMHSQHLIRQIQATNKQLENLTNRDPLTGVYNRRYIDQYLETEVANCIAHNRELAVLIFDLDFFKNINDTYGHSFGDMVLTRVAKTIANNLRENDVFARFGGEEFIAVLHDDSLEHAMLAAQRLRTAVSEISLRNNLKLTVSIGMAGLKQGDNVSSLFDRADKKLYEAKKNGRNQVCC